MIEISNAVFPSQEQLKAVALGMRNPMNSLKYSDTPGMEIPKRQFGQADYDLAKRLCNAGKNNRSHTKFLRQMPVMMTINAPMYWWKEADTYKIATVRNSASTMHKIQSKKFTLDDFSTEHLMTIENEKAVVIVGLDGYKMYAPIDILKYLTIPMLNICRDRYNETKDKDYWWQMIQLLPSSYNQTATVSLNYEVLHKIYIDRHDHKLDEWRQFCQWIKDVVPMSDLIVPTGDM